jgi:CheY-like chemotaxis protein
MEPMKRILIAEDQTDIRDLLALNLQGAGYQVVQTGDGREALAAHERQPADLLVLDLMMPHMDGLEVCKTLRARGCNTPILMLTAKSTELDRVLGLELGADDYLTKPFSLAELLARVKALLRRADLLQAAAAANQGRGGPLIAQRRAGDPARPSARCACGAGWSSSPRWSSTAAALCAPPGACVFARATAQRGVGLHPRRLRAHRHHPHQPPARQARGRPAAPGIILTVRGAGYKMREASAA